MDKKVNHKNSRNIKLTIQYDGTAYGGWQRLGNQKGKSGIQELLEEVLSERLKEDIRITGSGRTDAGVHALGQTANFHCTSSMAARLMKAEFNQKLPEDIRIQSAEEVGADFHSRFSARSKTYEYWIDTGEVPFVFTRKYACHVPEKLDVKAMGQGAVFLIGTHDFKAFSTDRRNGKSTVRTIEAIDISYKNNSIFKSDKHMCIAVTGEGFLYHMVRIIVGTLLEIGKGMRRPEETEAILLSRCREKAGMKVYPSGLFLTEVRY